MIRSIGGRGFRLADKGLIGNMVGSTAMNGFG